MRPTRPVRTVFVLDKKKPRLPVYIRCSRTSRRTHQPKRSTVNPAAREADRLYRPLDCHRWTFHLDQRIHVRVFLESDHRSMKVVLRDMPFDLHRDDITQPLENRRQRIRIAGRRRDFLADLESVLVSRLALPVEIRLAAGGGFVHPEPQHVVTRCHRAIRQIVPNIQQSPGIDEASAGGLDERPSHSDIVHHALQLDFTHS